MFILLGILIGLAVGIIIGMHAAGAIYRGHELPPPPRTLYEVRHTYGPSEL